MFRRISVKSGIISKIRRKILHFSREFFFILVISYVFTHESENKRPL